MFERTPKEAEAHDLVRLATAPNPFEAHIWQQALEEEGIRCQVLGDYLDAGVGDIPGIEAELWVEAADLHRAEAILRRPKDHSGEAAAYHTLGIMGSLGHAKAFGQVLGIRLRGFPAWWVRRTYYLLQLPGWARRLHVMADWTFALLFRPDIVKIDLACESALLLRDAAVGAAPTVAPSLQLEGGSRS